LQSSQKIVFEGQSENSGALVRHLKKSGQVGDFSVQENQVSLFSKDQRFALKWRDDQPQ
jgi:hypothetical protein